MKRLPWTRRTPRAPSPPVASHVTQCVLTEEHARSQGTYRHLADVWASAVVTHATYDAERGSLSLSAGDTTARLAVLDDETARQIVALVSLERTTLCTITAGNRLALVVGSGNWQYWLRPDAAFLVE